MRLLEVQRIVAGIEEFDLGAERRGGPFRLVLAAGLDLLQRHPRLLPGELGFPALAERQAHDLDAISFLGVQRDRAAGAPDEVAGVGRYNKSGFHGIEPPFGWNFRNKPRHCLSFGLSFWLLPRIFGAAPAADRSRAPGVKRPSHAPAAR